MLFVAFYGFFVCVKSNTVQNGYPFSFILL